MAPFALANVSSRCLCSRHEVLMTHYCICLGKIPPDLVCKIEPWTGLCQVLVYSHERCHRMNCWRSLSILSWFSVHRECLRQDDCIYVCRIWLYRFSYDSRCLQFRNVACRQCVWVDACHFLLVNERQAGSFCCCCVFVPFFTFQLPFVHCTGTQLQLTKLM